MKMRHTLIAASAALALAAPLSATAALTPAAGLPGATSLTFNDAVGATYAAGAAHAYPGATITGIGDLLERDQVDNTSNPFLDSNFATGTQLIGLCGNSGYLSCMPGGTLRIVFAAPVFGFTLGADDYDTTQSYAFTATAFNGAASIGSVVASSLADNGAMPAILAATSPTSFTSLVISDAPQFAGTADGDFVVGNIGFTTSAAAVPEPASLALIAVAAAGLAGIRRRSRA